MHQNNVLVREEEKQQLIIFQNMVMLHQKVVVLVQKADTSISLQEKTNIQLA